MFSVDIVFQPRSDTSEFGALTDVMISWTCGEIYHVISRREVRVVASCCMIVLLGILDHSRARSTAFLPLQPPLSRLEMK
jgi:hypothetical protein